MEHADLVAEMAHVEHLSTQERLHLARKRRIQQLKVWAAREKDWLRHQKKGRSNVNKKQKHIFFNDSVMLLEAAARNDIEEVERLLKKGVNPDSTNEDGLTALHQCCIDDNERMMKLLLDYGANVNAEDSEKWTPLHAAATCGHLHLVRYLINSGANLLAVNADGNMPYDICEDEAALDHIESAMAARGVTQELIDDTRAATELKMLQDLEQHVAKYGTQGLEDHDHQGATPLHIAAANGYIRVVEFLLDQHVSTDVRDNDDWHPVHAAACWGHMEVLELLVQNGADLNAKTKHDETPADICEDAELRERIIQLRSEQETKRAAEAQRKRVRRSQSNTRTQSVRRTSIRDKTLTSKKDAQEEARLRLQAQEVFIVPVDNVDCPAPAGVFTPVPAPLPTPRTTNSSPAQTPARSPVPVPVASSPHSSVRSLPQSPVHSPSAMPPAASEQEYEKQSSAPSPPGNRSVPEGQDNDSQLSCESGNVVPSSPTNSLAGSPTPLDLPAEAAYVTDTNGKINIHVSVTINAGTLADLKKQRASIRNGTVQSHSAAAAATAAAAANSNGNLLTVGDAAGLPPPGCVKRFAGNTSDVVEDARSRRCCIIS
ncbi:Protein phosphatase 1 regulatory subunit 16A [Frankliniella fusca]|uniref:Protein phosphatase 1 regulatory subunit 16A n=1 Tax=Frankliniella fusca TaxID=407009 RepID=A0AAE1GX04_9NEOP|nr:Protein phosphatase 1 regulatory subunit 16A [Frankliniella fusca]